MLLIDYMLPCCLGQASSVRNGKPVTCVWCRAEAAPAGERHAQRGGYGNEGYINLGAIAGCSPVRDTSTCESAIFWHLSCIDKYVLDHGSARKWRHGYRQYEYED